MTENTDEPIVPLFAYVDPHTLDITDPEVFEALKDAVVHESRRRYQPLVRTLLAAGWWFELPGGPEADDEIMSWYWRRPPRRKGSRGKLYHSTDQAYNALMRETGRG
jgi:hypothetical protein